MTKAKFASTGSEWTRIDYLPYSVQPLLSTSAISNLLKGVKYWLTLFHSRLLSWCCNISYKNTYHIKHNLPLSLVPNHLGRRQNVKHLIINHFLSSIYCRVPNKRSGLDKRDILSWSREISLIRYGERTKMSVRPKLW